MTEDARARERRRFVTGLRDGRADFVVDEAAPGDQGSADPRHRRLLVWGGDGAPVVPNDGGQPETAHYFPDPGGWRAVIADVPPGFGVQQGHPPAAAGTDALSTPGALHATTTVDMVVIVAGRLRVMLESGEARVLQAGDSLVQNGLGHSWSNPFDEVATMATFVVGGRRT